MIKNINIGQLITNTTHIKNPSLIFKLFLALALFIIIPVLIVGIVSDYTILRFAETEISKSGIGKLKVAKSVTELLAGGVDKDALHLSLNSDLNRLNKLTNYKQAVKNVDDLMLLSRFSDTLAEVVNTNNIYQSISLYIDNADYVFSSIKESNSVIPKQNYIDSAWIKHYKDFITYKTKSLWLKTRMPKNSNIYIPTSASGVELLEPLKNYVITYMYPLTPYITKLRGALVINIYEDSLSKLINSNNFISEGYICIINSQGDVISHVDKQLVAKNIRKRQFIRQIVHGRPRNGYLVSNINGKKYLITYLKTDFNGWIYVGVFPLSALMGKVTALRLLTLYVSIFLVLMGVSLSFVISRKLYHPVQQLLQDIKNRKGIDIKGNENELAVLAKAFDMIISQDDMLSDALSKNKRENYIQRLLREDILPDNELDPIGVGFSAPYFGCVLIAIDKYEDFLLKYPKEQQYYLKVLIQKVAEEILGSAYHCTGLVLERERIALIINTAKPNTQTMLQWKECFIKVQLEMSKVLDNTVSVGISDCHEGMTGIKASYYEAQEALKLKLIFGYGKIIIWEAVYFENKKYYYPFTAEKHLLNNLELGLKDGTLKAVGKLMAEIHDRKDLSFDNIIQIFNQLIGNTVKYLVESRLNISDILGDHDNIYQQLAMKETLTDIECWLIDLYSRIFDYYEQPQSDSITHIAKIMDYIHQYYKKDIDINTLADYVDLSYSHVRKIFHDQTGENIVNYINNLRIAEAKRLLRETALSINDIALSLGYNNNQSFNRFFKKYEGVTPGEFRNTKTHE